MRCDLFGIEVENIALITPGVAALNPGLLAVIPSGSESLEVGKMTIKV